MAKYIDTISRQAAIRAIKRAIWDKYIAKDAIDAVCNIPSAQPEKVLIAKITLSEEQVREAVEKAKSEIVQMLPSAQPEIIRCKDCAHYNAGFECLIEGYGIERDKDWYCADAERRTDE